MWRIYDLRLATNAIEEKDLLIFESEDFREMAEFFDAYVEEEKEEDSDIDIREFIIITKNEGAYDDN